MTRKEKIDVLLSKISEDKKEAFVAELRAAKTKEERGEILKKYSVALTGEEAKAFKADTVNEISDAELDKAAGGCCHSDCYCSIPCGGGN